MPPLHIDCSSSRALHMRIADIDKDATFIWFSGQSEAQRRGSVMVYLPVAFRFEHRVAETAYRMPERFTWASRSVPSAGSQQCCAGFRVARFQILTRAVPKQRICSSALVAATAAHTVGKREQSSMSHLCR